MRRTRFAGADQRLSDLRSQKAGLDESLDRVSDANIAVGAQALRMRQFNDLTFNRTNAAPGETPGGAPGTIGTGRFGFGAGGSPESVTKADPGPVTANLTGSATVSGSSTTALTIMLDASGIVSRLLNLETKLQGQLTAGAPGSTGVDTAGKTGGQ